MSQPNPVKEAQRILIRGDQSLFGTLPVVIKNMIDDQCWLTHTRQDGSPFASFRELVEYKLYWGLETPFDDLVYFCRKDRDCVRLLEENRGELAKRGAIGNGRGNNVTSTKTSRGNSADYRKRRLRRDNPQIWERLIAGEFPSVAEAERAAGVRPQALTKVERVVRGFSQLSNEEKKEFIAKAIHSAESNSDD